MLPCASDRQSGRRNGQPNPHAGLMPQPAAADFPNQERDALGHINLGLVMRHHNLDIEASRPGIVTIRLINERQDVNARD